MWTATIISKHARSIDYPSPIVRVQFSSDDSTQAPVEEDIQSAGWQATVNSKLYYLNALDDEFAAIATGPVVAPTSPIDPDAAIKLEFSDKLRLRNQLQRAADLKLIDATAPELIDAIANVKATFEKNQEVLLGTL